MLYLNNLQPGGRFILEQLQDVLINPVLNDIMKGVQQFLLGVEEIILVIPNNNTYQVIVQC